MELTQEDIARHYSAALDSVSLINGDKPENTTDEEWADTIARNKEHLTTYKVHLLISRYFAWYV